MVWLMGGIVGGRMMGDGGREGGWKGREGEGLCCRMLSAGGDRTRGRG